MEWEDLLTRVLDDFLADEDTERDIFILVWFCDLGKAGAFRL